MWKIYLIAVAIAGMLIGGFWLYQRDLVKGLQDKVTHQQEQIAGITIERDVAKGNYEQAKSQMIVQQQELVKAIQENSNLRAKDTLIQAKLFEYEKYLNDEKNKGRVAAVLLSKTDLVIRLIDKQIECETKNFYNTGGKCVRGEYVKDGERLVPANKGGTK